MIAQLVASDRDEATALLVRAFAHDPLMHALFDGADAPFPECVARLMELAFETRASRGWTVVGDRDPSGAIRGVAYLSPPSGAHLAGMAGIDEPERLAVARARFEAEIGPRARARYNAYEASWSVGAPAQPHHYLGVLGVDPVHHGTGVGIRLLDHVFGIVDQDPHSAGVWLDTEYPPNVGFYRRRGFVIGAERPFGEVTIWGMWRPRAG